ncbi:NADH:ubiquinone oxidoreductase [Rhodobacterales bacterium HKCCE3408]|nr:NADH:ubiquinone oxidoreductase [Rhodobacterales bacterium HKCCE3408]
MSFAEQMWLGATAAQRNAQYVMNYSAAFYGTAAIQMWKMGVEAPMAFWQAMARADSTPALPAPTPAANGARRPAAPTLEVVEAAPESASAGPSTHLLDAPRGGTADDLTVLSGVGAKLATALNEFGIYHFDQIASLDEAGIDWLNDQQPGFKALAKRFDLVGQAKAQLG